jgi:endogenous inhibitor of DNA gyrase (YacG/DUF329 family)
MKEVTVSCPNCKTKFNYFSSEFRPFCCERCKLIDLGLWLNESYTVPVNNLTDDEALTLEHLINEKSENDETGPK